jgi:hypothetical protein
MGGRFRPESALTKMLVIAWTLMKKWKYLTLII